MSRPANIAIVGLSLSNQVSMRESIAAAMPAGREPHWVNIAQPNLDLIVINVDFASASSVQKIISYNPVPMLQIDYRNSGVTSWAEGLINIQQLEAIALRHWLDKKLNQHHQSAGQADPEPARSLRSMEIEATGAAQTDAESPIDDAIFKKIHHRGSGRLKLFDARGLVALVDTAKEMAWLPNANQSSFRVLDQTLNSTHSTHRDLELVEQLPVDLRQWLWQQLWRSPAYAGLVTPQSHVTLLFWPQPDVLGERRLVLRMAAAFQQGASIARVAEQLELPVAQVQQFAAALVGSQLGRQMDTAPVAVTVDQFAEVRQALEVNPAGGARGFFSKLRARLGL